MDLLFEIGLEEIPARMIAAAQAELQRRIVALLERERLIAPASESRSFSTPRRLAVWVAGVATQQADVTEDLQGPAVKIAFKDGVPGPAAVAFAKKAGIPVESLRTISTPKGDYLAATSTRPGRDAVDILTAKLPKELAALYWAKTMTWHPGKPERFVRPVRWMLALLGELVIPIAFGGKVASNTTRGHRVLANDAVMAIGFPDEYEQTLRNGSVMADVETRRQTIRKALDRVCRATGDGLRWREDHALVDKLTHLTEWPTVIAGAFDAKYLALPEEVLVTVMRDHQSYFAVQDATGKLAPHFLAVLNAQTDAAGEAVIRHGNERVLRARFNDAEFFWHFDQRLPLLDRLALLEKVTFQKDLGSYAAKTARTRALAQRLANLAGTRSFAVDEAALDEAATLAKTDLTTDLVKEFTELQGQVGGLYARAQGYPAAVADAIYDHYLPKSMEDAVPRTSEGAVLALADKADTIAGMFSLGLEPTGSRDPFALRRAANGIVKILAECAPPVPLTLGDIADAASPDPALRLKLELFFADRLDFYLREARAQAYDVVKAVLAAGANDVRDTVARAEAVSAVRGSADFAAVSAAFKRMKNILAQAKYELPHDAPATASHQTSTTSPDAEELLHKKFQLVRDQVDDLAARGAYVQALESVATMRPEVDAFFAEAMVMDPDEQIRNRRLTLLARILQSFFRIADFSEIVVS